MASTYTPIATTTLGSSQASVTFSSISSAYTDLILVANFADNGSEYLQLQFNSDTGTNYSITNVVGDGTSAVSNRKSTQAQIQGNWYAYPPANTMATVVTHIQNYSNATTYKTVLSRASSNNGAEAIVGLWRSTSAINTIKVFLSGSATYNTGSTFTLYGIKAA